MARALLYSQSFGGILTMVACLLSCLTSVSVAARSSRMTGTGLYEKDLNRLAKLRAARGLEGGHPLRPRASIVPPPALYATMSIDIINTAYSPCPALPQTAGGSAQAVDGVVILGLEPYPLQSCLYPTENPAVQDSCLYSSDPGVLTPVSGSTSCAARV